MDELFAFTFFLMTTNLATLKVKPIHCSGDTPTTHSASSHMETSCLCLPVLVPTC